MNDRDTFAAAALTGFIRGMPSDSIFHLGLMAKQSYEVADAMLRERGNHSEKPNSSPTLTDEEREAIETAAWACGNCTGFGGIPTRPAVYKGNEIAATLRSLMDRLT